MRVDPENGKTTNEARAAAGCFPACPLNEKCVLLLPRASCNVKKSNFLSEISWQIGGLGAGCVPRDARNGGKFAVQRLAPERHSSIIASPKALPVWQFVLALPRQRNA